MSSKYIGEANQLMMADMVNKAYEYTQKGEYKSAYNWYLKAAEQGYVLAQYKVGEMHTYTKYTQDGVEHSYSKAFYWYYKAAAQGSARAQHQLGLMHQQGMGTEIDWATAKKWYGKACSSGSKNGCNMYKMLH